jgi:peptidoglycan/LPS O-acetylase OafA/YrhL
LYPIAVILGFVAIAKRKIALAAGALGLLAWIGTLVFLSTLNAIQYTGFGVYVGIVGAIIMAVAYFIKPGPAMQQTIAPPPPPVQQ